MNIYIYICTDARPPTPIDQPWLLNVRAFVLSHMKSAQNSLLEQTCMANYLRSGLCNRYSSFYGALPLQAECSSMPRSR